MQVYRIQWVRINRCQFQFYESVSLSYELYREGIFLLAGLGNLLD